MKQILKLNFREWVGTKIEFYEVFNIRWLVSLKKLNLANQLRGKIKRILKFNGSEWGGSKIEFYEMLDTWWLMTKAKYIEFSESVARCNETNFEIQLYQMSWN